MFLTQATGVGQRPYQEDRISVVHDVNGTLFAVFDGHGGHYAADKCATSLESTWNSLGILRLSVSEKLRKTAEVLGGLVENNDDGTTASLAYIPLQGGKVTVAVIGDSPVLTYDGNGVVIQSPEHNVRSNPAEAEAVQQRGGIVAQGYAFKSWGSNGLQMSRSLGDASLASILSREPEIYEAPIGKGGYVLVATDGLFDPGHGNQSATGVIIKLLDDGADAQALVDYAINVPTYDNASAILVRF